MTLRTRILLAARQRSATSTALADALEADPTIVRQTISRLRSDGLIAPANGRRSPVLLTGAGRREADAKALEVARKVRTLRERADALDSLSAPFTADQ